MNKTFVPLSVIKQKARQLKRQNCVTQHEALDEAAAAFGFSNYKHYLNEAKNNRAGKELEKYRIMDALADQRQREISSRISTTESTLLNLNFSVAPLIDLFKQTVMSRAQVQTACENYDGLSKYLQLIVFKDVLEDESAEINDYAPYHVPKSVSLNSVVFGFKKEKIFILGNYDLNLEFAFDHDKNENHPAFQDDEMFGSFEVSISRDMKVQFTDGEIGFFDRGFQS